MAVDLDWSKAVISERKLTDYLLAIDHPEGGPKAAFFLRCGFDPSKPSELADALVEQAGAAMVSSTHMDHRDWSRRSEVYYGLSAGG